MQAWWHSGRDPDTYPTVRAGSSRQMGVTEARQVAGLEKSHPWPYLGWMQVLEGTGGVLCISSACGTCQAMQDH